MRRPRRYVPSRLERVGIDDAVVIIRGGPWALAGGGVTGAAVGGFFLGPLGVLLGGVVGTGAVFLVMSRIVKAVAWLVGRAIAPDGIPYTQTWSRIEAHVARGELDAAAVLYEEAVVVAAADFEVRVKAADFFAGPIGRPARALELFRAIQSDPAAPAERQLYASQRIVDLHLGPLADKGRAIVELRRIVDRWPNSHAARFGRDAVLRLKAELHAEGAEGRPPRA